MKGGFVFWTLMGLLIFEFATLVEVAIQRDKLQKENLELRSLSAFEPMEGMPCKVQPRYFMYDTQSGLLLFCSKNWTVFNPVQQKAYKR